MNLKLIKIYFGTRTYFQSCTLGKTLHTFEFPLSWNLSISACGYGTASRSASIFPFSPQKSNCFHQKNFCCSDWTNHRISCWTHPFRKNLSSLAVRLKSQVYCTRQMFRRWLWGLGSSWCLRILWGMFWCSFFVLFKCSLSLETDLRLQDYCFPLFFSVLKIGYRQLLQLFKVLVTEKVF